ncbi:MAG: hypothetical protein ABEI96_06580, partial [Haloarculaceae archaeon]
MHGEGSGDRERALSTVLSVVLLVAITLSGALLVVTVGGSALDTIQARTSDDLVRDSLREFSARLSALAETSTTGSTSFAFPDTVDGTMNVEQDAKLR